MKFLYIQDTHIRGRNSEHRIGNYYEDVMVKINEVVELSKKIGTDCVLHGGDIWDSANVSNVMLDEFIDLVEAAKIPWYVLPGTHDMIGHDWALSKGSTLAHAFRRSRLIHELTTLSESGDEHSKWFIQGFKYYHNCESDIAKNGLMSSAPLPLKIAVTHAFITLKPFLKTVMHVVAKDIATDFDIVLNAHYHCPWGIKRIGNTKWVNIGAFGRKSIDEIDIKPTVVYIDTDKPDNIELIPLTTAKPGNEVFDLTKVTESKVFEQSIDDFINSLQNVKMDELDVRGIVELLAKDHHIDLDVKKEVIKRIGENT